MSTTVIRLRELRKRAQKSQEEMAAVLHITRSAYSKLERGQTELSVKRACQIAQFLNIPVGELLLLPAPNPAEVGTPAAELLFIKGSGRHRREAGPKRQAQVAPGQRAEAGAAAHAAYR